MKPQASANPVPEAKPETEVTEAVIVPRPATVNTPTQPIKKDRAQLYEATDKKLIIWFIYNEIPWQDKEKKSGYKTIFWFEPDKVRDLIVRWQSPEPIVVDLRKFFVAEDIFYSAIHDG